MHVHILGIGGTFMGGLAMLASDLGFNVTGQDQRIYPPMSNQLQARKINVTQGYEVISAVRQADVVIIGNVMKRGMPVIEYMLDKAMPQVSGPQFIANHILNKRHVLVVTGTHGKTTTASMLAWILEYAGFNPGFLIGGVPENFKISASLGDSAYFVIEGDEYDSAFFDKRSKFLHYRPKTVIINNLEFDHVDIFPDLSAIQKQFQHLLRIIPESGLIIYPNQDLNIESVISQGCWTPCEKFSLQQNTIDLSQLKLIGEHNQLNALAAITAAKHVGVNPEIAMEALQAFKGVKRRLEYKGSADGISIYSDFAHHPTAIIMTIKGLRSTLKTNQRLLAIVDICSNTMRQGVHQQALIEAVASADLVMFYHQQDLNWDAESSLQAIRTMLGVYQTPAKLIADLLPKLRANDVILCMSNGSFESICIDLLKKIKLKKPIGA